MMMPSLSRSTGRRVFSVALQIILSAIKTVMSVSRAWMSLEMVKSKAFADRLADDKDRFFNFLQLFVNS